jgi:hypothetical protein
MSQECSHRLQIAGAFQDVESLRPTCLDKAPAEGPHAMVLLLARVPAGRIWAVAPSAPDQRSACNGDRSLPAVHQARA